MSTFTISGKLDADRLLARLSGAADGLTVTPAGDGLTEVRAHGPGRDLALTVPDGLACDASWWAASVVRRELRRVPDADACASPGLESVLRTGLWRHPDAPPGPVDAAGVVLFKPGMAVGATTLRELARRLADCGYRADRARVLEDEEIVGGRLADDHYLPHTELARRGTLTAEERIAFLRVYDRPEFRDRFGARPQDLAVVCAYDLLVGGRLSVARLEGWSTASAEQHGLNSGAVDGPNEIGDCLFVNVYKDPAHPAEPAVVVINPHMPGVLGQLEDTGHRAVAVLVAPAGARPLPWARVRREFCGVTDPARALPGSLRGDALAGLYPLSGPAGEPVRRTNNGVHLSNGAIEALQDARTWFGLRPDGTAAGQALRASGLAPDTVLARPFLEHGGRRRAVATLTDGLGAEAAAAALTAARLCEVDDFPGSAESVRRVDIAWRLAGELGREPGAVAVLATGSVGRNRACPDSDLNLLVLDRPEPGAAGRPATRRTVDGVEVSVEHLTLDEAEHLTRGLDDEAADSFDAASERLGAAARLGGLVLLDPEGHAPRLAERAAAQRVPAALLAEALSAVRRRVAPGRGAGDGPGWDEVRGAAYDLARLVLATGPTRFHKAKWVPADLRSAARPQLWDVLREAWQLGEPDEERVRAALGEAGAVTGADHRALADARGLLAAGQLADALFCARFAAAVPGPGPRTGGAPPAALAERITALCAQELERAAHLGRSSLSRLSSLSPQGNS
ncbi:hypothetical protein [Streptomyces sp. G-G2]|uniref:hypothetical protein n=1 Tax=Streptomyces sp. G-G2 TaxID=3046201 RepID=UPI0024B8C03C|nr:hypothetical protein [Streptomyces sp. G-G2]MDJ0381794.1 hypothetical protein [Streptomyces sp. G-G2]